MKHTPIFIIVILALWALVGCQERYTTLQDTNYVMFAEQEQYFLVEQDQDYFSVMVSATTKSKSDRTFGVEVIDKGSNAIEGLHYRLLSNSVTIPAGSLAGEVRVKGMYDNLTATDSLGFILHLVVPEEMEWNDLYEDGTQSKVVMYKYCPFDINNYTGYAIVSSMILQNFPGDNVSYQRIIKAELHPTEENTIILRDCFYDGYDLSIKLQAGDPENPLVRMEEQVMSDEGSVLGMFHGDNRILVSHSPNYASYFNTCENFVVLWAHVYVEDLGEAVGTIGHFYNIVEWITKEEADDLRKQLQ